MSNATKETNAAAVRAGLFDVRRGQAQRAVGSHADTVSCQLLLHHQPVSLMFASQAVSDPELARIDAVIADLPALDAAFAPPVCRHDGSQPREEGAQG